MKSVFLLAHQNVATKLDFATARKPVYQFEFGTRNYSCWCTTNMKRVSSHSLQAIQRISKIPAVSTVYRIESGPNIGISN